MLKEKKPIGFFRLDRFQPDNVHGLEKYLFRLCNCARGLSRRPHTCCIEMLMPKIIIEYGIVEKNKIESPKSITILNRRGISSENTNYNMNRIERNKITDCVSHSCIIRHALFFFNVTSFAVVF